MNYTLRNMKQKIINAFFTAVLLMLAVPMFVVFILFLSLINFLHNRKR